jgi:hypothetical protein
MAKMRAALEKRFCIIRPPFSCEGDSARGLIGGKFLANDLASNARRPTGALLGKVTHPLAMALRPLPELLCLPVGLLGLFSPWKKWSHK